MQYRRLGKTGLQVSAVSLGGWQFAGGWGQPFSQEDVTRLLHRAHDLGVNLVDTAECYGHHLSEQLIGHAIKGQREHWVVCTKFGHNQHSDLPPTEHYQPTQVLLQLDASLQALQTDYIDVYQLHSGTREHFDNDALWTMLDQQVSAGKIRFLGNSIGNPNTVYQVEQAPHYGISVIQTMYNAARSTAENTVFPLCKQHDLGVIARVPLESGFLSGKYLPGQRFNDGDVRGTLKTGDTLDREINGALTALRHKPPHIAAATWALAWCLRRDEVSCVIPGVKSIEQLEMNVCAADIVLPSDI